ncbi:hypothetical protein [uncultured Sphingomonas sp.]|uniref:hypothetical protein n=1 Tax=uncultured Sphingomonas sp. TaxID=158754 RepID=UPI0025921038|nr:hypothetical protein [uncultured Sphingomonas sp.]
MFKSFIQWMKVRTFDQRRRERICRDMRARATEGNERRAAALGRHVHPPAIA